MCDNTRAAKKIVDRSEPLARKLSGYEVMATNLPALEGTPKQVAWAEDLRAKWEQDQNALILSWSETAPVLMQARSKAVEAAKAAGITYRDGEGSEVYNAAFDAEMKRNGIDGTHSDYMNAFESYQHNSAITDTFPVPIQKKALKSLGLATAPKTKDVENRVAVYSEATKLYLQSEKRARRWIDTRDTGGSQRIVYSRGEFVPLKGGK